MDDRHGQCLFREHAEAAVKQYPGLSLQESHVPVLAGKIYLEDTSGHIVDDYDIHIRYMPGYPDVFPFVFETGGKIPVNVEWHVFESDGHLCLCTSTDEYLKTVTGLSLTGFITNELVPYLYNQTYRRMTGFFLHEMAHGEKGELDTLKNLLRTNDLSNIRWLLQKIMIGFTQGRTSLCFCGSKQKYRHCHRDAVTQLGRIRKDRLQRLVHLVENSKEYQQQLFTGSFISQQQNDRL